MSHKAPIKIGRLVTVDLLNGDPVRADISLYQRGALKLHGDTPLLVDHDDNRPIGEVHELVEFADSDGSWVWARTTITEPPGWLEKGTKPSVGYKSLFRGGMGEWSWVHRGLVTEVSILSPGVQPAEPLARVALPERTASPAASPDRPAAGETIIHTPGVPLRRYFATEITVR